MSPLPPVSGGHGQPLAPMAVWVTVLCIGSRDEVTFPDSTGIWAGRELRCVSCPDPPGTGDFLCMPGAGGGSSPSSLHHPHLLVPAPPSSGRPR